MVHVLADVGGLQRERVAELPLNREVPLIGYSRAIVRFLHVNPDTGKTGGRHGANRVHVARRSADRRSQRSEALIQRDLVGGDRSVGSGCELPD
jgi:hypothetical protein